MHLPFTQNRLMIAPKVSMFDSSPNNKEMRDVIGQEDCE